jgi:uncharacterized protein YeeX (DUF496 family)
MQVDDIVTEILVRNELKKNKISVSKSDVDGKVADIRTSLGTATKLEDVLAQRDMTMADFRNQVELQMGIEKLMKDKVTVTDAEIASYVQQNAADIQATTDAGKKAEALNAIQMSKLQTAVNDWITKLKADNKVWKAPGL